MNSPIEVYTPEIYHEFYRLVEYEDDWDANSLNREEPDEIPLVIVVSDTE